MWNKRESPLRVEKRFEFEEYSRISKFMKMVEELCKDKNIFPNISFGKNFVSIVIFLILKKYQKLKKIFQIKLMTLLRNLVD